ncbi:hypothetical protein N9R67_01230 [Candidatus Actinomarina sp.]|nr:hypothetical protein [Candidatus Actinomarina sp.]
MSKYLIVTHQFLPHVSPRTTRWKLLVDELVSLGHEVTVLTGTKQHSQDSNFETIFVGNSRASNVVVSLRNQSNSLDSENRIKSIIFKLLKKVYRFVIRNFAWPDYTMFWLISVFRVRKKLNLEYDVLITVSLPFSSHIAGYLINKKIGKPWIMDVGDPFTLKTTAPENNSFLYGRLNKHYEMKFYKQASKVLFTHDDARKIHIKEFHINPSITAVGQPISKFREHLYEQTKNYNYTNNDIKFGYFGIFTHGVRSPVNFINFLDKFQNYEMHWYINSDSESILQKNKLNSSKHIFNSHVARDEALQLMTKSFHCLVSIGNLNPNQIPSKVIEYIATGKPVIHFAEINNDPVIHIADEFDNLFIVTKNTDINIFKKDLNKFFLEIDNFDSKKFNKLYSPSSLIEKLDTF